MKEAVIVEAVRTPMGRHSGILKDIRTDDLAAHIIAKLVEKTGINKEEIEDVYFGCTNQAGEDSRNVARNASLLAGLPYTIPGATVNRLCGSGLEAVNQAGRACTQACQACTVPSISPFSIARMVSREPS